MAPSSLPVSAFRRNALQGLSAPVGARGSDAHATNSFRAVLIEVAAIRIACGPGSVPRASRPCSSMAMARTPARRSSRCKHLIQTRSGLRSFAPLGLNPAAVSNRRPAMGTSPLQSARQFSQAQLSTPSRTAVASPETCGIFRSPRCPAHGWPLWEVEKGRKMRAVTSGGRDIFAALAGENSRRRRPISCRQEIGAPRLPRIACRQEIAQLYRGLWP